MNVKFYIKRSKFAVINEKPKIWLNVSFRRQKKFKNTCTTVNRSELILKRNTEISNREGTKPQSMLSFQEAMGEISHKQHNLILTSLQ